ncbi:MAG: hypothetical protein V1729_03745 [Candidatus Woesearchaeota archaeon]
MRAALRPDAKKKMLLLAVFTLMLFISNAAVVEAGIGGSLKNTWGSVRVYVLSMAFWLNALIIFGIVFLLYTLLLSSKVGSNNTQQIMMYIVIGVIALVIATKIVATNGAPQYVWQNDQFRKFTQFAIGPQDHLGPCSEKLSSSFGKSLLGIDPNPPCCGTGAYFTTVKSGRSACKQAILRTNENGSGLPAFIVAAILFYLLFSINGAKLGFDKMGSGGGKWFPIVLTAILAALVTNDRMTKDNLVMIGGWIAVVMIGSAWSKTMSGDGDKEGGNAKKGFGFGFAFALVELIANILGSSLLGGSVAASEIGTGSIFRNLILGLLIGFIYSAIKGQGVFGRIRKRVEDKKKKEIDKNIEEGSYLKAYLRAIPFLGRLPWFKPKKAAKEIKKKSEMLQERMLESQKRLEELKKDTSRSSVDKYEKEVEYLRSLERELDAELYEEDRETPDVPRERSKYRSRL